MHTGESGDVPQYMSYLGVAQLVERVPWEHEAGSSSLPTQTNSISDEEGDRDGILQKWRHRDCP